MPIRRPSRDALTMAVMPSATSQNSITTNSVTSPTAAGKSLDTDLIVSAKKVYKLLRALDPRADNAHRGKERVIRLNKFRSYVDGKYSPDGTSKPPFREEDVLVLFLGTKLEGDTYIPGLLRACGAPSSNHSRSGHAELLKKSALPAMDLLRYLVCDLHITEANANSAVFGDIFCKRVPPAELRQLRLPLHLAGFGGKREGSREDASRILTHYLLYNAGDTSNFSPSDVLEELLGPTGSEARLGYGGWLLTQSPELRRAAQEAGVVDVMPNKKQVGSVMLVKTDSDNPLSMGRALMDEAGDDTDDENGENPKMTATVKAAPGPGLSRRLSDQAFGMSARQIASADRPSQQANGTMHTPTPPAVISESVSMEDFATLKSELAVSRANVETLETTVSRLSDTVADLLNQTKMKEDQASKDMVALQKENADMRQMLEKMLLDQNEMKSKMGLMRLSKETSGEVNDRTNRRGSSYLSGDANSSGTNRGNRRSSFLSMDRESDNSMEGGAGLAAKSIRNVFNAMRNEVGSSDDLMAEVDNDGVTPDSLLWDD